MLVKVVISSKTRIPVYIAVACRPVLLLASHDDFSNVLLPALQKAMLRNPELILYVLGKLLANVSLDLSKYSFNLGKTIAGLSYTTILFRWFVIEVEGVHFQVSY